MTAGQTNPNTTQTGDGDGDGESGSTDGTPQDIPNGDGDPTGDGDGDPTGPGDGDGDPTGPGDGDGDPTAPAECGNGIIDDGEQCDGGNLGGFSCLDLGYSGGTLGCDPVTCTYDASGCVIDGGTGGTTG